MKKSKKLIALFLTLATVVAGTAACGMPSTSDTGEKAPVESTDGEKETTGDEEITLRIVDWSDSSADLRKKFHEEYMANNPHITIEYTTLTMDQFKSSVVTSIKSGDAPDLFPVPSGMSLSSAMKENWYQPMNDYFPADFWDTLSPEAVIEGVATIDGNYYTIPEVLPITNSLFYYNQDVLDAAGVTELPKTYSEFIDVNKKVTEAGAGKFYGLIEGGKQLNRMQTLINAFANVGGAKIPVVGKALMVDGRMNYDSKAVLEAFELFKTLYEDGSIHPDTVNIGAPEAREYFAQGEAAFLMQGNWCISVWDATYPDMNYGVMTVPAPDSGAKGYVANEEPAPWMGIYSQSKHPQAAADYLMALYSYTEGYTYQEDLVATAGQLSIVNGMVEEHLSNPHAVEYYNIAKEESRVYPSATVRDIKVYDFYANVVDVQPNVASLLQGVISGGLNDYKSALTTLSENVTAEWKRAAEETGLDISVLEFENWDTMKEYTADDYSALAE